MNANAYCHRLACGMRGRVILDLPPTCQNPFYSMAIRSYGWCWTINNPTDQDDIDVQKLIEDANYVTYGVETGESNTTHYQGYCYYKKVSRFSRIKKILRRAHIEKQRGNNQEAIQYCHKENNFFEWGTKPENSNQKCKWQNIMQLAKSGQLKQLESEHPRIYLMYSEKLKSMIERPPVIIQGDLPHEWWYGPTGTGKSKELWEKYPLHYQKKKNKWWDGFYDQDIVAIEEWSPDHHMLSSHLKEWADRYPFQAEIKNGTLQGIRPLKIIVLSNYTIKECFPRQADYEPLLRRFQVKHFPALFRSSPTSVDAVQPNAIDPNYNLDLDYILGLSE